MQKHRLAPTPFLLEPMFVTPDQYLMTEKNAEYRSEYYDGTVRAMGYISPRHGLIVSNIIMSLGDCLKKHGCQIYPSERMVFLKKCNLFVYPDVVVVCKKPAFQMYRGEMAMLTNPTIVVEVLSKTSKAHDLHVKLPCYKSLPSLKHILIIDQDDISVDHLARVDVKKWLSTTHTALKEKITTGRCALSLKAIYDQTDTAAD
jgi:Uma2 family endonuclease